MRLKKLFKVPDRYSFHNRVVHYPALILLGPGRKKVFRYIGKNNPDGYSFDQFISKIDDLKAK